MLHSIRVHSEQLFHLGPNPTNRELIGYYEHQAGKGENYSRRRRRRLERAALRREPRTRTRSRGGTARPAATPWKPRPRRGRAARRAGRARSLPRARPPEARRRGPGPSPNGSPGSRTPSAPRALPAGVERWRAPLRASGESERSVARSESDGSRGLVGKLLETEEIAAETRSGGGGGVFGTAVFARKQLRKRNCRIGPRVPVHPLVRPILGVVGPMGFPFP